MDSISLQNHGRELVVNTPQGQFTAYGPLDPKNKGHIDVETPSGQVVKMNEEQLLRVIVKNASSLERTPENDSFSRNN